MIDLQHINVSFQDKNGALIPAVNDVNLSVEKGEILGIVGYSGAGKSTLVRVINLLQRPSSGSVFVNGSDLMTLSAKDLRDARKKIGMIFQHFNLMNARTVKENVLYPLKNSQLSKLEREEKVKSLLELVGLADKCDVYPSQLSGGQKQRVAIARALANDPQILLCDEATSALDPKTTLSILKLLKSLNESMNLTIVLITHELQVVKDICHKVAVMENGKIVEKGESVQIFSHPKHSLTKNFIRITNHTEQAYESILYHPTLSKLTQDEQLLELTYGDKSDFTPFMSILTSEFSILITLLYSYSEIIDQQAIGSLIIKVKGEPIQIEKAVSYLNDLDINVARLSSLQDENYYTI